MMTNLYDRTSRFPKKIYYQRSKTKTIIRKKNKKNTYYCFNFEFKRRDYHQAEISGLKTAADP